jgi:hypothetical protein
MLSRPHLPARFPIGTKYVLDGRGPFVRRYIEFPNGRRVQLATRKALSCTCVASQPIGIVPDQSAAVIDAPSLRPYGQNIKTAAKMGSWSSFQGAAAQ